MPVLPRRKLIRLQNYDYSTNGYYFLTFCTRDRKKLFGKIEKFKMKLNDETVGESLAKNETVAVPLEKKETVGESLGKKETVGAPLACAPPYSYCGSNRNAVNENQIELSICGQIVQRQWLDLPNQFDHVALDEFVIMPDHIHGILIINNRNSADMGAQASGAPTVSDIIRSFKSRSTLEYLKFINANNLNISAKIWQRSFHDHIIRHEIALMRIRKYIIDNPMKWKQR
jgi:REP element-mobilizing transposase RayT